MIKTILFLTLVLQVFSQKQQPPTVTCTTGQFYDRANSKCVDCSTISNSAATTTRPDVCDCNTGFFWKQGACVACSSVTNAVGTTTVVNNCDCSSNYFWKREGSCEACPTTGCPVNPESCTTGQYVDRVNNVCAQCSAVTNSAGTTTVPGVCDCNSNYYWKEGQCVACPTSGCPTKPSGPGGKDQKPPQQGGQSQNGGQQGGQSQNGGQKGGNLRK